MMTVKSVRPSAHYSAKRGSVESAIRNASQKKRLEKKRSTSVTEKVEVIGQEGLESKLIPPKDGEKNENHTTGRQRKRKQGASELEPRDKNTT